MSKEEIKIKTDKELDACPQSPDGEHASTVSNTNGPYYCRRCGKEI